MEAADAEAAQTETLKKLCAKDKCDIDPKAIFDTSSCPGMQFCTVLTFIRRNMYVPSVPSTHNCLLASNQDIFFIFDSCPQW